MKIVSILAAIVRERETSFSNFQDFFQATFKIVYTSLMFSKRKKKDELDAQQYGGNEATVWANVK